MERLRNRRIEEENAMNEWRKDCERVHNEMRNVMDTRRQTWSNWLRVKEEAARLTEEEVNLELDLIKQRDFSHEKEVKKHNRLMEKAAEEEQATLDRVMKRSAELSEQKAELKRKLEEVRRNQLKSFSKRRDSSKYKV